VGGPGFFGVPGGPPRPAPVTARPGGDAAREPDTPWGGPGEAGGSPGPGNPATAAGRAGDTDGPVTGGPVTGGPVTGGPAPGARAAASSEGSTPRAAGGQAPAGGAAGAGGQAASAPAPAQAAGPAVEEWPDDAGEAGGGTRLPTGMELIQRELGGKVIEEFEEP
jgi:hypothetical protein